MIKTPLFTEKKEVLWASVFFLLFLLLSFGHEYYKYEKLTTYSLHVNEAKVLNSYTKISKKDTPYQVLKLQSDDITFYTTLWKEKNLQIGDRVRVGLFTKNISFYEYLKGFFAPLKFINLVQKSSLSPIEEYVLKQHSSYQTKSIYGALFFAKPLSKNIREKVATWGLAHLIAISGFHLALLSAILFFLLKPIYTFFQNKYFPYRNINFDLSLLVFTLLGFYAYFINLPPSLIRAFSMGVIGFLLFHKNINLFSFKVLFLTIITVIIFFPKLLFSLGFWFSVSGVFYIYLYLHHFMSKSKAILLIGLNFWVFILMIPIVHSFFDMFSWQQLFSPFISIAFAVFYPLSLALHVVGIGDIFDKFLEMFINYPIDIYRFKVSLLFLCAYIFLSLIAIRFRLIALALPFYVLGLFFI